MKIFVSDLPGDARDCDVREAFQKYGRVSNVTLFYEFGSRCCAGYGHVEMPDNEEAKAAISSMRIHPVLGRTIHVREECS